MSFWEFPAYVPVAKRRADAAKQVAKLKKQGRAVSPVVIEGRKIAKSFWGKAWCDNLERYSDFANRLPRGRAYVNNGSVIDLQLARGKVRALVSGSEIYKVEIDVAVAAPARWKAICADCAGSVGSIVELLQGKLSKHVMERVCRPDDGLFPAPREITMSCSCSDWADMCKHVAATLYGVGARLDHEPDLLFTLRGVDRGELISADTDLSITEAAAGSERVLADADVAALFGVTIETAPPQAKKPVAKEPAAKKAPAKKKQIAGPKPASAPVAASATKKGAAKTAGAAKPPASRKSAAKAATPKAKAARTPKPSSKTARAKSTKTAPPMM
ncbi:MAG: hypothetical protein LBI48_09930 [Burkholderiaceae bacterium]|jgi:uncharacterized Zn finger protein|nr:hypothetical protein [Burkholderiaceae bacterium]